MSDDAPLDVPGATAPVEHQAAAVSDALPEAVSSAPQTPSSGESEPAARTALPPVQANVMHGTLRAMQAMQAFYAAKSDYETSVRGLQEGTAAYEAALQGVYTRAANKALEVARANGGVYIKAAQFVASMQGGGGDKVVPRVFVDTLKVLTDKAPSRSFADVDSVLVEDLGASGLQLFASIEPKPIAAASLAQVHVAMTHDGQKCALKVQYPELRANMASDLAVFRTMGSQVKPGGMDITWLVDDFERFLSAEVDFRGEADNTETAAASIASFGSAVHVPSVLRNLSGPRVLTTTFVDNLLRVDDVPRLRAAGLHPWAVGSALSAVFSHMALCTGHVHGDPHAGNVYVRAMPLDASGIQSNTRVRRALAKVVPPDVERKARVKIAQRLQAGAEAVRPRALGWALALDEIANMAAPSGNEGVMQPQVVLLDHGLYHSLDESLRTTFGRLFLASVATDSAAMRLHSGTLAGVPPDVPSPMRRFFPLVLSHWFVFGLGIWAVTPGDISAARQGRMPPGLTLQDLSDFLTGLHGAGGNVLGVLHSMGYTRGLLNGLAFPERRRLRALAQAAARGCGTSEMAAGLRVDILAWVILPMLSILVPPYHLVIRPLWVNTDLAALISLLLAMLYAAYLHL